MIFVIRKSKHDHDHRSYLSAAASLETDVLYLIQAFVPTLGMHWSVVVRQSVADFSVQLVKCILNFGGIKLTPQAFTSSTLDSAALAFKFLSRQLYSNSLISSFLDPTIKLAPQGEPAPYPTGR